MNKIILILGLCAFPVLASAQSATQIFTGSPNPQPVSPSNPLSVTGASPGAPSYTKPSPYTPLASSQTLTVTTSAQPLPTPPTGALYAELTISAAPVVWRDDGSAPVGTGVQQWQPGSIIFYAVTPLTNLQLILPTGGATATVGVAYYK